MPNEKDTLYLEVDKDEIEGLELSHEVTVYFKAKVVGLSERQYHPWDEKKDEPSKKEVTRYCIDLEYEKKKVTVAAPGEPSIFEQMAEE